MFNGTSKSPTDEQDCDDHGYVETDPTGRYGRFKEVLGRGAMKTMYKAIDEVLGMEVAWSQVKLNDLLRAPEDLQRLYSEVHLLSTLNHDSIIKFYTSWIDVDRRTFNFITEMFTSGNLREYRRKYNRVDIRAIKIWARQILSGLVYLHGHDPPVIHRSLKCDNIFVNGHLGQVKIGDLGLAAILRRSCRAHSLIGTLEFMAPELYEENYSELVDVYSFGMCILEMLTHEYPYSECINPAQIYKKVTSGKFPRAFYKVQDLDAQRFIGKCLGTASKRLSAKELLLDPFLAMNHKTELLPISEFGQKKPFMNDDIEIEALKLHEDPPRTNMTITGKLNAEDDTIFLKVQIADKEGSVRNVFFPFEILSDTPDEVAAEMVKELEITDWEPCDIADMIEGEISGLVPHWKWDQPKSNNFPILHCHEDEDEHSHPFHSLSSSSSQTSFSNMTASQQIDERARGGDWLQDYLYDDTSSQGSVVSGTFSNLSYHSGEDHESLLSPTKRNHHPTPMAHNSTRFCHEETSSNTVLSPKNCERQPNAVMVESQGDSTSKPRLTRNRSLVDKHSQLLHRSLVEEVSKRRLFKTVGAVEDVGFQTPCLDVSRKSSKLSRAIGSMKLITDGKRQGYKGKRV